MPLTKKQRIFVEKYLTCFNASEAARQAGYSKRSAGSIGSETLKKPEIQAYYEQRLAEQTMTADECLTELANLARSDTNAKIKALELIGKTHKLFVERQEIEIEHGASDALLATIGNSLSRGYGHSNENE